MLKIKAKSKIKLGKLFLPRNNYNNHMDKIINKLQDLVKQDPSLPEQRKKEFLVILDDFRTVDNQDLKKILESVLEKAEKDINYLIKFLEEVLAVKLAYIQGGAGGVKDILQSKKQALDSLKDFSQ